VSVHDKHQRWLSFADSAMKAPRGTVDVSALAQALQAATCLAMAEQEYRQAIVEMVFVRQNISVGTFADLVSAQEKLNRTKARLREAGGEP
jgi:hypothetical protein